MFTYLTCQFTIRMRRGGCSLSLPDWMVAVHLTEPQCEQETREAFAASPLSWPDCLLLSEADLIVKVGDRGVQAQGSVGQPYFLTQASRARGDGGQHVKLNLIPRFPSLLSCIFIGAPGAFHF